MTAGTHVSPENMLISESLTGNKCLPVNATNTKNVLIYDEMVCDLEDQELQLNKIAMVALQRSPE